MPNADVGIFYNACANGETWEFCLTINGHRVGASIFRKIEGDRPTVSELAAAFKMLCTA